MKVTIETFTELLDNKYIIVEGFREHSKASEKYIDVTIVQKDGFSWKGSIPYFYRRTGLFIETLEDLTNYLNEIYPLFSKKQFLNSRKLKRNGGMKKWQAKKLPKAFSTNY